MKKFLVSILYNIFKIPIFERALLQLVKGANIESFLAKFIPPNYSYPNPTYRKAKKGNFIIDVNIFDYNDWKAYWSLKETERENLYNIAAGCTNIIDVGVNNGWLLMHLAEIVKPKNGVVYGFEPHPVTFKRCKNNISTNNIKNVVVFNLGCGAQPGKATMITAMESNSGQNRIESNTSFSTVKNHEIKIIKLDEQLNHLANIDLIKIDVEGFEKNVLLGAEGILKKFKPVLFIEIDDALLKLNQSSAVDIINFIKATGYSVFIAETNLPLAPSFNMENCHFDIICK